MSNLLLYKYIDIWKTFVKSNIKYSLYKYSLHICMIFYAKVLFFTNIAQYLYQKALNMGNIIKLTENDLHRIICETLSEFISEDIKINPKNRGKFNATKKRTGKSTEELTHSKNPLTRKRAIFAQNAKRWRHK